MRKYPLNKQCEFCSNTFVINNGAEAPKRFCNKSCAASAHNIKHPPKRKYPFKRTCEYCGEEFDVLRNMDVEKRFCDASCAAKHNNSQRTPESYRKQAITMTKVKTCAKCSAKFSIAHQKLCQPCFDLLEREKHQKKYRPDVIDKYSVSDLDEMRAKALNEHNVAVSSGGIYIVYKSINLATNQYYIGVHKHKDGDGYLGSGLRLRRSVKSYGSHSFIRYTLHAFMEPKEAFVAEKALVAEWLSDPLCLNLAEGGQGGALFTGRTHSEKTRALLRGKKFTEEERAIKKEEAKVRKKEYYNRKRVENAGRLVAGAGFEPA